MADSVKRRVAAARLAVAFVAAGTIAGASAWAQASPPAPTAQASAYDAFLKIKSPNIINGSLLFKDFKPGEIYSEKQANHLFLKVREAANQYLKIEDAAKQYIKGESSDFLKPADADARYLKLDASVMHGDGSVLTASKLVPAVQKVRLLDVPGMFTVDAQGPTITITNTSGGQLQPSSCTAPAGSQNPALLDPNQTMTCDGTGGEAQTLQLIGAGPGGGPQVSTLNFSAISTQNGTQTTVQILIGLLKQ